MLKRKNIPLCYFLGLITFGLYSLYWFASLTRGVAEAVGEKTHRGGWLFSFANLFTGGLYGAYWFYKVPARFGELRKSVGLRAQELSKGIWILFLSFCSQLYCFFGALSVLRDPDMKEKLKTLDSLPEDEQIKVIGVIIISMAIVWVFLQLIFLIPAFFASFRFEKSPQTNYSLMALFCGAGIAAGILQANVNNYLLFKSRQRRGIFKEVQTDA